VNIPLAAEYYEYVLKPGTNRSPINAAKYPDEAMLAATWLIATLCHQTNTDVGYYAKLLYDANIFLLDPNLVKAPDLEELQHFIRNPIARTNNWNKATWQELYGKE